MDVESLQEGAFPKAEMAALSRRFRPALMAFFLRRLRGDHARAEDLTQEVFVRLVAMPDKDMANPDAYLFQIASNLIRDQSRRLKVRQDYSQALMADDMLHVDLRDAERIVLARENIGQVATLLDALPERTRSIFVLFRLESMSRKTIADAFGISLSAVDKHLRKALTVVLGGHGGGNGGDDDR